MKYLILFLLLSLPVKSQETFPIQEKKFPVTTILISWNPDTNQFTVEHRTLMEECLIKQLLTSYFYNACDTMTVDEGLKRLRCKYEQIMQSDTLINFNNKPREKGRI